MLAWTDDDVASLPPAEDDTFEYKSSRTPDDKLEDKLTHAASGMWNSGGGVFVAGVDDKGQPDGGLPTAVGRQSRRDWIDRVVARVTPRAGYAVHAVEGQDAGLNIAAGRAVYVVAFGESSAGPHMAPDDRYYIRAGAHTVPARHFIVDSLFAQRGLTRPLLRAMIRRKPGNSGVIQLGVVALSEAPGIDVEIAPDPLPSFLSERNAGQFPLRVPVVNALLPFFFDFDVRVFGRDLPRTTVHLRYKDIAAREYEEHVEIDAARQLEPVLMGTTDGERIERQLKEVENAVRGIAAAASKNEQHLSIIARKLK